MKKRPVIISEFIIQVFTDGKIMWDGFDGYLLRRIHHRCRGGHRLNVARLKRDLYPSAKKRA